MSESPGRIATGYYPHEGQKKFHASKVRFRILVTGVRWGKTKAGAAEIVGLAQMDPGKYWVISPTFGMLQISWEAILEFIKPFRDKIIEKEYRSKNSLALIFKNGARIEGKSAEWPDTGRGAGLKGVWMDEASYIKREFSHVIRTRVSDLLGRIWVTTTPKGKNWVWEWFCKGMEDRKKPRRKRTYESFRYSTKHNPHFPRSELAAMKRDLPLDFYEQEVNAKFLDDALAVFVGLDKCIRDPEDHIEFEGPYWLGIDWAKKYDFTAMTMMDNLGSVVEVRRFSGVTWNVQRQRAVDFANAYAATIVHDATGLGDPLNDELRNDIGSDRVIGVVIGGPGMKANLIRSLQVAIESVEISISKEEEITLDEMRWFECEYTASGHPKFSAPKGYNSDCCIALALANWGRVRGGVGVVPVMVDSDDGLIYGLEEDDEDYELYEEERRRLVVGTYNRLWHPGRLTDHRPRGKLIFLPH